MIRGLSESEMEDASGGFSLRGLTGLTSGLPNNVGYVPNTANLSLQISRSLTSTSLVAMAPPEPQLRAENTPVVTPRFPDLEDISRYLCRNRRGHYGICTEDGVNERWESYKPQQPSFRSRFMNR